MSATEESVNVEVEARKIGWRPEGEFRGQKESWVDAKTYLERGQTVLPILRAENRHLKEQLTGLQTEAQTTKQALAEATAAIQELKNFNSEIAKTNVKAQKEAIVSQLAEANAAGNHEEAAQLTNKLSELNASLAGAAARPAVKEPVKETPAQPVLSTEVKQWLADNPWFGTDKMRTSIAYGAAEELKSQGRKPDLSFYEDMGKRVEEIMPTENTQRRNAPGRVSASNGSDGGGGGPRGKTFADLPAEAKAVCDRQGTEKLVGKGKTFETKEAWRQHYVNLYFSE